LSTYSADTSLTGCFEKNHVNLLYQNAKKKQVKTNFSACINPHKVTIYKKKAEAFKEGPIV